jgi:hypothetical protein
MLGAVALDRSNSRRNKQQQSTGVAAAAGAAAISKSSSCRQEQQRQELWSQWLPLQHQWMLLQQLQQLKKVAVLERSRGQARGHKPLPGEEVLKHQMFCGAQSQPCQSCRSAGCPKKEKSRKKRNAERSWNWIWSTPCQSRTKSKSVSCPGNKDLLVLAAYQETTIQNILSVFVVVTNFYARCVLYFYVLVFQYKNKLFCFINLGKTGVSTFKFNPT